MGALGALGAFQELSASLERTTAPHIIHTVWVLSKRNACASTVDGDESVLGFYGD
jgi:hypothetical protein